MRRDAPRSNPATRPVAADPYVLLAAEELEDRRRLRWALGVATVLHLGLFLVTLPELAAETPVAEERDVFVVKPVRFKQPPPEPESAVVVERVRRVAVPDPTPDAPEPLVTTPEPAPELLVDALDTGIVGIPEAPPPLPPEGPIRVHGDVRPPVKVFAPPPSYTEPARRARITGLVIVEAVIDRQGRVTSVEVLKDLPMGLDRAAAAAIRGWRFEPATLNGKPVSVIYNLTINFQLQ